MMKLYTSHTSPFGRKCRMAAELAGVADLIEIVEADYKSPEYKAVNPLGKVPALGFEDGRVMIDSPVIAAYLASLGDVHKVYPEGGGAWEARDLEALADGLTDVAILVYLEAKRADGERSDAYLAAQRTKADAALDELDRRAAGFSDRMDIGVIALAAGLSWIELRAVLPGWRNGREALAGWLDAFAQTAPMQDTRPPEGA